MGQGVPATDLGQTRRTSDRPEGAWEGGSTIRRLRVSGSTYSNQPHPLDCLVEVRGGRVRPQGPKTTGVPT